MWFRSHYNNGGKLPVSVLLVLELQSNFICDLIQMLHVGILFKYRVFWVTISDVSHGTVSNLKNSQFCTTYFIIYVTTLEIGQSAHLVCKWLVIPIKMQGNNVFGNGSGNANSMRFQGLPRSSIEVEVSCLVLAPG